MDWHWNTGVQGSLLFSSVKIHHLIVSTQSKSLSRRRWRSPLRPSYWWMQEKTIRQYRILVSWGEEGLRQCPALVNWQMDIISGKKEKDERKGFNIDWIQTILINSCTFEQFKDIQEVLSILHCKTMYCHQKVLRSFFITSRWPRRNPMRLVTSKNRATHKYLETLPEYSMLVQFEARSTKRTAILSNKVKRSYSPRHTACRVHWESDMHEDPGSALSKGKRDSKTACCSWS